MRTGLPYRFLVFGLAALFAVFTVGIPVVVAACPMTPAPGKSSCGACGVSSDGNDASFRPMIDRSCCSTVFAAAPADAPFLKAAGNVSVETTLLVAVLPNGDAGRAVTEASLPVHHQTPLRSTSDISILISSLLI